MSPSYQNTCSNDFINFSFYAVMKTLSAHAEMIG